MMNYIFMSVYFIYSDAGGGVSSINRNLYKPPVSEAVKDIVRANFTRETEFYQFCRQRLHRQYQALNLVWPLRDLRVTSTWPSSDLYVTSTWPSSDLYVTFEWPLRDLRVTFRERFTTLSQSHPDIRFPEFCIIFNPRDLLLTWSTYCRLSNIYNKKKYNGRNK
jgi:hypothetical protein